MSTKGVWGFKRGKELNVMSIQHDAYVYNGFGENFVLWLSNKSISTLNRYFDRIDLDPNDDIILTPEELEHFDDLMRDDELITVKDAIYFGLNGLHCEYGYIFNLDTQMLEFYSSCEDGINRPIKGIFADLAVKMVGKLTEKPITLISEISLEALKTHEIESVCDYLVTKDIFELVPIDDEDDEDCDGDCDNCDIDDEDETDDRDCDDQTSSDYFRAVQETDVMEFESTMNCFLADGFKVHSMNFVSPYHIAYLFRVK